MDNLFIKNQTGRKPTAFLGMDEPATRFEVQIPNTVYYMLDQSRNEHCYTPIICQQQVPGTTNLFSINMDKGHVNNGFGLMECHCKSMCLRLGLPYRRLEYLVNTNRNCLYS
nr:unnamed protein product [Callosobruchus analis]